MYKNNIEGFKCFNKDFSCNYGNIIMKPNTLYKYDGIIKYNNSGYHFCKRLEDTLRFFDGSENEIIICHIKALGEIDWGEDKNYDYYDMGCTDTIYIDNIMSRKEIIDYANKLFDERFIRFIMWYKLNDKELLYFKNKYSDNIRVLNFIKYYQEGDKEVFNRECGIVLKRSR